MTDHWDEKEWAKVWAAWVIMFAVAEGVALRSENPRAPLSHHMRRSLGIRKHPARHYFGQVAFGTGVTWLAMHLYKEMTDNG